MRQDHRYNKSKTDFEDLLHHEGYIMNSPYIMNSVKVNLTCPNGHSYPVTPNSFKCYGSRCKCHQKKKSIEFQKKFMELIAECGYTLIGTYGGSKTNVTIECNVGHKFNPKPHNLVNNGTRCPECVKCGYSPSSSGTIYLTRWVCETGYSFLKLGITNRSVDLRIKQQAMRTKFTPINIISKTYIDGSIPPMIESRVKSMMTTGVVSKDLFGDGYTETIADNVQTISQIKEILNGLQS